MLMSYILYNYHYNNANRQNYYIGKKLNQYFYKKQLLFINQLQYTETLYAKLYSLSFASVKSLGLTRI